MLYRNKDGNLVEINRFHYHNDKNYYKILMKLKTNNKEVIEKEYKVVEYLLSKI